VSERDPTDEETQRIFRKVARLAVKAGVGRKVVSRNHEGRRTEYSVLAVGPETVTLANAVGLKLTLPR
jgi:hypothetical protein